MKKRGFTLIELLVVIAIISLLVSVLLPSLTKARELGRAAVNLANLHQIGSWSAMKSEDNGGYVLYNGMTDPAPNSWSHYYQGYEEESLWSEQLVEDMGFDITMASTLLKDPQWRRPREYDEIGYHTDYALNAYMGGWNISWVASIADRPRPLSDLTSEVYLIGPGGKRNGEAGCGTDLYTCPYSENDYITQLAWPWPWKVAYADSGVQAGFLFGDFHADAVTYEERDAMSSDELSRFYKNPKK